MDFLLQSLLLLLVTILLNFLPVSSWPDPIVPNLESISMNDRLLSIFRDNLMQSSSNEKSNSARSESLKKMLEFLNSKVDNPNKKLPSSALQEISALTSGLAKTPRPINLEKDDPTLAVVKYFQDLGITSDICQQRTVCELLTEPQASYGVFGELINYVFGKEEASLSARKFMNVENYKKLFIAAENGRRLNDCSNIYSECSSSYKDYIKLVTV